LLPSAHISLRYENGLQEVYLQGENVSEEIRTPQVSRAVSAVSAIPEVREFLFGLQQQLARENNVIMDGRDIGTVVLPQAQVKIFLTASPEDRAQRRFQEMQGKGQAVSYETVLADIRKRDEQDTHRAVAPLKQAADAVRVDTTGNTLEESVTRLSRFIRKKLGL
jgi:cytidylate kinase